MSVEFISENEYSNIIDSAIKNKSLEFYGTFAYEGMAAILGKADYVNVLMNSGFFDVYVIPMSGVTGGVHTFVKLNQRWVDLKRCGSYSALMEWEKDEQLKASIKTQTEREFIHNQNEFLKINNVFVTKQSELIVSQLETNTISRKTSRYIAAFTGIAGMWYLHDLLNKVIPGNDCYNKEIILLPVTIVSVCLLMSIIWHLGQKELLKSNKQKPNP